MAPPAPSLPPRRAAAKQRYAAVRAERLPTNTTANRHAVHRWFNFIAGFSPEFVAERCAETPARLLLDPFAGCGTALVVARDLGIASIGYEPHPFFARIARAKTARWPSKKRLAAIESVLLAGLSRPVPPDILPAAAALFLGKLFAAEVLGQLLGARQALAAARLAADDLAFLLLSRVLDLCSRAQTDGIYKAPTSAKRAAAPEVAICSVVEQVRHDLAEIDAAASGPTARIIGESSEAMPAIPSGSVGLVVTSPPYLNNFDFAEMTRMYLYFWGMCASWREITDKVRSRLIVNTTTALGGHRGIQERHRAGVDPALRRELDALVERLRKERARRAGKKEYDYLVYPYFAQMTRVLGECLRCLAPGGAAHVVVADAAFYGIHVSTPQILTTIMADLGFRAAKCTKLRARGHRWILEKRDGSPLGLGEYHISARKGD